jgi:putative nucleotidyltransferase with HDIG domain
MKTTTLWLDQCMPGMRVAETITNRFMATIVNEGTVLDTHIIEKLKYFNYQKLRVYVDSDKEIERHTNEAVLKEYAENALVMKSVLLDISAGKNLDMPTIARVSDMMHDRLGDFVGILACLNQVRDADEYTYSHCLNVAYICLFIAKWLNFEGDVLHGIIQAGLLHDVGKCRIPNSILNKPSVLTDEEFKEIKKHPVYGYRILEKTGDVRPSTALAALMHHEKINGKGYPMGITGDKIHLFGKIAAVADIYDAMTSNRVYHKRSSPFQVFKYLEDLAYGSLDPAIVVSFLRNLAGYYVGDRVTLSDGREGYVVFINPRSISRPIVQTGGGVVNLENAANKDIYVSEMQ